MRLRYSVRIKIVFRISFSNRPDFSVECQQFILYYIDLVHSNKTAIPHMYYLPPKMLLVMFLRRCKVFSEVIIFSLALKCGVDIFFFIVDNQVLEKP